MNEQQHRNAMERQPPQVHHAAADGYTKQADAYGRGRPLYQPELAVRAAQLCRGASPSPSPTIELGAGTGIFTKQLVRNNVEVIAVEPVAAMRAALTDALPAVTVLDGTAERLPVDDRSAAAVVASQSFHWFDYGPAIDEIARVLQPDGYLITVWNVRDNNVDWVAACTAAVAPYAGDTPRHHTMNWRRAIDSDKRFEPVEDLSIANPSPTTQDGVIDRVLSTSFIAALDADRSAAVVRQIREIVRPLGSTFDYPYVSELQAWRFHQG